ncbi:MAG: hypothetical protein WBO98_05980, partial [Candidatus Nitrotoga sp.]
LKTPLHFNKVGRIVCSKTAHAWQVYCLFRSDQTAKENPPCMRAQSYTAFFPQASHSLIPCGMSLNESRISNEE